VSDAESTLITGIGELVSNDGEPNDGQPNDGQPDNGQPGSFAAMTDAALVIAGGKVAWTGPASRAPAADAVVDVAGRAVLPGFADSHAHLVLPGSAARSSPRGWRGGRTGRAASWARSRRPAPPRTRRCGPTFGG
jgi:imidazolonepropionase